MSNGDATVTGSTWVAPMARAISTDFSVMKRDKVRSFARKSKVMREPWPAPRVDSIGIEAEVVAAIGHRCTANVQPGGMIVGAGCSLLPLLAPARRARRHSHPPDRAPARTFRGDHRTPVEPVILGGEVGRVEIVHRGPEGAAADELVHPRCLRQRRRWLRRGRGTRSPCRPPLRHGRGRMACRCPIRA